MRGRGAVFCLALFAAPTAGAQVGEEPTPSEPAPAFGDAPSPKPEPEEPSTQPPDKEQAEAWGEHRTSRLDSQVEPRDDLAQGNGVYGRFGGDLDWGVGAGAEVFGGGVHLAIHTSLHYFSTAGLYLAASQALGDSASAATQVAAGADLRPLFLPRWSLDLERGPPHLDLVLDSLSLGAGIFWRTEPQGSDVLRGFEASLGFGVPFFSEVAGPWLRVRGSLRWVNGEAAESAILAVFAWHTLFSSPWAE